LHRALFRNISLFVPIQRLPLIAVLSCQAVCFSQTSPSNVQPVTIPLYQNGNYNLEIYAALNGGIPVPYLFDTGSYSFYSAYVPRLWPGSVNSTLSPPTKQYVFYGDGTYGYTFDPTTAAVSLFAPGSTIPAFALPAPGGYQVGKIETPFFDYTAPGKYTPDPAYAKDVAADQAGALVPPDSGFFGTFGAGPWGSITNTPQGTYSLSNLIAEVPGGGYVVAANGPTGTASVTIGLNDFIRSQFPYTAKMTRQTGAKQFTSFPISGNPAYTGTNPPITFTLTQPGMPQVGPFQLQYGLDTGTGDISIGSAGKGVPAALASYVDPNPANKSGYLRAGTTLTITTPNGLSFTETVPANYLNINTNNTIRYDGSDQAVIGYAFYQKIAVMYDLDNGIVGFTPNAFQAAPPPTVSAGGIVIHAGTSAVVSPGSLIDIYGTNLALTPAGADVTKQLPTSLGNVKVTVNGAAAPLIYVSEGQIICQVPYITAAGTASVVVTVNGVAAPAAPVTVQAAAPNILTYGTNRAVVQNQDYSVNSAKNAAAVGTVLTAYLIGSGPVTPALKGGEPAPSSPLSTETLTTTVSVGGVPASVYYAGLTPGFVGLMQVNFTVPKVAAGDHPMQVTIGTAASNSAIITTK
jgi:uncharacterized protein (TIGR03437 family)